jgi:hypothetical protein
MKKGEREKVLENRIMKKNLRRGFDTLCRPAWYFILIFKSEVKTAS